MKLALLPIVAAALLAAPAAAQVPEILLWEGDPLPATSDVVRAAGDVLAGPDAGYLARITIEPASGGPAESVFWGDLVDDGTTAPAVLRRVQTIAGMEQESIYRPRIGGGRIAYESQIRVAQFQTIGSLWRDDDLLFQDRQPSPFAGFDWGPVLEHDVDANGEVIASTYLRPTAGQSALEWIVMRFPTLQVLLRTGDVVPGYPQPVDRTFQLSTSPNGLHYACVVLFADGVLGLVVDGAVARIDGVPLLEGQVVPLRAGGDGSLAFHTFADSRVDDRGRLAISVGVQRAGVWEVLQIRDGYRARGTGDVLDGFVLESSLAPHATRADLELATWLDRVGPHHRFAMVLEGKLLAQSGDMVDIDGDGIADAPNRLHPRHPGLHRGVITARGDVLFEHITSDVAQTWFRYALLRLPGSVGDTTCVGQPNSTGRAGRLAILGSDRLGDNSLCVRAYDLPPGVAGYFLASRMAGFVVNPGGSMGDLCLSGPIGRYASQSMTADGLGAVQLDLDLRAVPQPTGSVMAQVGETWHFQCWHRDSVAGVSTSNFTPASRVVIR